LAAMEAAIYQMESGFERGRDGREPDWRFHRALAAATRDPLVFLVLDTPGARMQNRLRKRMRAHNFASMDRGRRCMEDHRAILRAVRQGPGEAAFRAMHPHIRMIQADLEAN
jgi:GntR family transcriptional regulator, transcriptional repressor for pyruvate dehydrogenase complex